MIGIDEHIGNDLIQIFTSSSDNTLTSLRRYASRETSTLTSQINNQKNKNKTKTIRIQHQATYAMPRILLIRPSSSSMIGDSVFTIGHLNSTSPPPSGGRPRRTIFNSKPLSMPKFASNGSVTVRIMSGDISVALFVTPVSVIDSGVLPNGAKQINASRKYPTIEGFFCHFHH